jgi:hypothetical protein
MKMLVAKLIRMEEEKREAEVERLYGEKGEISFGHQIRSYTLQPYTLVKDLRTGLEVGNADGVLDGNILKFMEAYLRHRKKLGGGAQDQDSRKSFYRFNDSARKALGITSREARRRNHDYVGTEHLLLGLIREESVAPIFKNLGVEIDVIRTEIEKSVESRPSEVYITQIPFTPQAKFALEQAMCESIELGHDYIGTEHLLLGLLREGECILSITLADLGVELARVRAEVLRFLLAKHDKHTQS